MELSQEQQNQIRRVWRKEELPNDEAIGIYLAYISETDCFPTEKMLRANKDLADMNLYAKRRN